MKKHIYILLFILIIFITITGCNASNVTENKEGFILRETPQTYVLAGEDSMMLMPTVTLFENGNAQLSQPMISSYYLEGTGHYEVNGDALTITYDNMISAEFAISDDGDTLTLKSADLNFTKSGSVYQYRSTTN